MSVSQIKKQFEEISTYLGRDKTGLEKLRKLKDLVNELRTRLAAATSESETATTSMNTVFAELSQAKSDLAVASQEIHRLQQVVLNLSRDLSVAEQREVSEEESDEGVNTNNLTRVQQQYHAMVKKLRKQLPFCPRAVDAAHTDRNAEVLRYYDRHSLSEGWSHQDIWTLGAAVAVLCAITGEVAIVSQKEMVRDLEFTGSDCDKRNHQTVQWIRKIFDEGESDAVRELCDQHRGVVRPF